MAEALKNLREALRNIVNNIRSVSDVITPMPFLFPRLP